MPSRFVGDTPAEKSNCPAAQKNTGFFPVINRNGSVGSEIGTDADSAVEWHRSSDKRHSRCVTGSVSNTTGREDTVRLPSIDRSKTNSICSHASSNISSMATTSRHQQCSGSMSESLRNSQNFHVNNTTSGDRIDSVTPKFNGEANGDLRSSMRRHKDKGDHPHPHGQISGKTDFKLPDIFSCKTSSVGSPVQSPSPTFRHRSRINKKKSASLQDLSGQLKREDSILGENYKNFNRSPTSSYTPDNHAYHRTDKINSLPIRSSLPAPVLFPMRERESESRLSRKSRSSVKRNKDRQSRTENDNVLKENNIKEVIEKLEVFSNADNACEDATSLVLGKPNSLQKVREEAEVDQYIYRNSYEHTTNGHKTRKRAQSEDRQSAKVH